MAPFGSRGRAEENASALIGLGRYCCAPSSRPVAGIASSAKPQSIMAHVEASGTAGFEVTSASNKKCPACTEIGAGRARLAQRLRFGRTTPVLTNGEGAGAIELFPKKARKRRRLALKSRQAAGLAHIRQRVVADCGGSYRSATQGARGDSCKLAACPCRPFLSYPLGEERAADAPSSTTRPPPFGRAS